MNTSDEFVGILLPGFCRPRAESLVALGRGQLAYRREVMALPFEAKEVVLTIFELPLGFVLSFV